MSHGRIHRSTRRYPGAKRRTTHFAGSRYGRRGRGLPPHLLPGVSRREKPQGLMTRRNFIIGGIALFFTLLFTFLSITIVSAVSGILGVRRAYKEVNKDLPDAARIAVNTFQTSRIYDRNGTLLQEVGHPDFGWRTFVSMDQMTDDFINATVAAEDATFWTNQGVEPLAILRGGFIIFSGSGSSGGSTITQQLVRAVYPNKISAMDISITRKVREALAAVAMAQEYSKEDIFTMYVNQIFYGSQSYGVEAAANTYFNKHASELTLAESALLAGLPQSPSYYDPNRPATEDDPSGFEMAKRRQRYVLNQMRKYGYITRQQADAAWKEPLQLREEPRTSNILAAPHFTQYLHSYVEDKFGEGAIYGGLNIYTSIDLPLQKDAERIVAQGAARMQQYQRNNAATVVICPWNGEILAMVGSADFNNEAIGGQYNYTTGLIQPGSSMKPIAYAAAFEQGWHPASIIMDIPTTWEVPGQEPYEPNNYTKRFYGAISAREALGNSFNISAVKTTEYATVEGVMDMGRRMGLVKSLENDASYYGLSLGLGAGEVQLLEHTNAFATLANNGRYVPARPIQRILDSQGNTLYETSPEQIDKEASQAMNPGNAYQVTSILTDNKARSFMFTEDNRFGNTADALGRPTAAKSGTTENWRDLWTMGYTSAVAVGAWVGRTGSASNVDLPEIDGIDSAGPIWQDLMLLIHNTPEYMKLLNGPDGKPMPKDFPVPDEAHKMRLCKATGHRPGRGETVEDWVVKGQEPTLECDEVDAREAEELEKALSSLRRGANWGGNAVDSINRYASAVGRRPVPIESDDDENAGDEGTGETSGDDDNESPPIEPLG